MHSCLLGMPDCVRLSCVARWLAVGKRQQTAGLSSSVCQAALSACHLCNSEDVALVAQMMDLRHQPHAMRRMVS